MVCKQTGGKSCLNLSERRSTVLSVSPRQPGTRPPADYISSGSWPTGKLEGPRVVLYARGFAMRLGAAVGGRSLREVAREAGLSHSTLLAVMTGARWPDMVTIAKLEDSLQADLWPGPEIRSGRAGSSQRTGR